MFYIYMLKAASHYAVRHRLAQPRSKYGHTSGLSGSVPIDYVSCRSQYRHVVGLIKRSPTAEPNGKFSLWIQAKQTIEADCKIGCAVLTSQFCQLVLTYGPATLHSGDAAKQFYFVPYKIFDSTNISID